jgi:hypothetical protein
MSLHDFYTNLAEALEIDKKQKIESKDNCNRELPVFEQLYILLRSMKK